MHRFNVLLARRSIACAALSIALLAQTTPAQIYEPGDEGTFSIIGRDPGTGQLGIAVHSKTIAVGSRTRGGKGGVAVFAHQSASNPMYSTIGVELLEAGLTPQQALDMMLRSDEGRNNRQVAILDAQGRTAAWTSPTITDWKGHKCGVNYCAQGNTLAGPEVVDAMARSFETSSAGAEPLAERLLNALDAGQAQGGDRRGMQSASLMILKPLAIQGFGDRELDLRVDEHRNPFAELRRVLNAVRSGEILSQANARLTAKDLKGALERATAAREKSPTNDNAWVAIANIHLQMGQRTEALAALTRAVELNPANKKQLLRNRAFESLYKDPDFIRLVGANDSTGAPGVVASEFVFETAPFASAHASTIVETRDGLVAAWFGGTREGAADVGIWLSRRVSGAWTPPIEVANGVQPDGTRHPCWNPVLIDMPDRTLSLFYKVGPSPQRWWGVVRTSRDQGRTWSDPRRLPDGILGPIKNKGVRLSDGTMVNPSSTESPERPSTWRVHFERSVDGGRTWTVASAPDGAPINAIQPSILIHSGDKLQAVGRTRSGRVFETWSSDRGKTWTPLVLSVLPNPSAGTDAVTLRDGRHLIVYNHTTEGRSPLNVALSSNGAAWGAALVLEREPGEYSYPAVIQGADGLVHITYTWRRQRIRHVVIDPAKLTPVPMADGMWPS